MAHSGTGIRYLEINPWVIEEKGFRPKRGRVSESIFSLGNEFMGVRGNFEEGYSGDKLHGSYFNGIFEGRNVPHVFDIATNGRPVQEVIEAREAFTDTKMKKWGFELHHARGRTGNSISSMCCA